jgi:hypothetical protein
VRFFLGTDRYRWLWELTVPLFVSRRSLSRTRTFRAATADWALDCGGFTELKDNGRWTVTARQYAQEVERWTETIGRLAWAPIQDWMCEPVVRQGGKAGGLRFAGTGLSIREHQQRTLSSWFELNALAPHLPWIPVLQGFHYDDYLQHLEDYEAAGVSLRSLQLVGLGSVCRRQSTLLVEELIRALHARGLRLHAFGFKTSGLRRVHPYLASSDSQAWPLIAWRRKIRLVGCRHKNRWCCHCPRWALRWREQEVLPALEGFVTPSPGLFDQLEGAHIGNDPP